MYEDLVSRLKELEVVQFGNFELSHSGKSDVFVDMKLAYGDPMARDLIRRYVAELIPDDCTVLAGSGKGGDGISNLIAASTGLFWTSVNKEIKNHGNPKWIDGYVPTDKDVVAFYDDVFNSGASAQRAINRLRETGCRVAGCYVVVNRGDGNIDVPLQHLITLDRLLGH